MAAFGAPATMLPATAIPSAAPSPALLRLLGPWNPTVRALWELQYPFEEPFVVDSAKTTDRLGLRATPLDRAVDETVRAAADAGAATR